MMKWNISFSCFIFLTLRCIKFFFRVIIINILIYYILIVIILIVIFIIISIERRTELLQKHALVRQGEHIEICPVLPVGSDVSVAAGRSFSMVVMLGWTVDMTCGESADLSLGPSTVDISINLAYCTLTYISVTACVESPQIYR